MRHIDASQSIATVYDETRRAVIPEVFFIIGPPKSGKKNLGQALAERTNMSQLFFDQFLSENSLNGKSDEAIVNSLIKYLVDQPATRVLLYEFPQNETQAKYFMKNCRNPSNVFYVKCSKDDCQERMLEVGKDSPDYLPSSILSKKIRIFNEESQKILGFLRDKTKFVELDTSN